MKTPTNGDLVYIKRPTAGVRSEGIPGNDEYWTTSLVTIEPNQTALVVKSYNPDALAKKENYNKAENLLQVQHENMSRKLKAEHPEEPNHPKGIVIILLAIGNLLVETVYDPDYIDIISS